ncbi:MAG: hypothetical protein HY042_06725 [Spirochaetia bacterium]|nr:hypothetical protein [Spirochaetia bacterium]
MILRVFRVCGLALAVPFLSCSVFARFVEDPRGPAVGHDYFRPNGNVCTDGPVAHEKEPSYLAGYALYRQTYFAPDLKAGRKAAMVITGDSIAALFVPGLIQKLLPEYDVANRGIGGDTTLLIGTRVREDILPLDPSVVVISIGGNDLLNGRCIAGTLRQTGELIDVLRENKPGRIVIITSVPPVLSWKANSIVPFYNARLKELAEKKGARFVDLWPQMAQRDEPVLKEEYRFVLPNGKTDVIHFNEKGYEVWSSLIKQAAGDAGKKKK